VVLLLRKLCMAMHIVFVMFVHRAFQTISALEAQNLVDENKRQIAAQVGWFAFNDEDSVDAAASFVAKILLALIF
jgi:hypothetical protein